MPFLKRLEGLNRAAWLRILARVWPNEPLRSRIDPTTVRRVLFIRYDGLGDMITTLPAIRLVKRLNPSVEIDVLASPRNEQIVRDDPNIARVLVLSDGLRSLVGTIRSARRRNYDVVISCVFGKTTKSGILSNATGPNAVKATVMRGERYRHLFNVQSQEAAERGSGWEKLVGIVQATFQCEPREEDLEPYLVIGERSRRAAEQGMRERGLEHERFVVVNISAFKPANRWTEEGFTAAVEAVLRDDPELHALIVCVESDAATAERIRACVSAEHRARCAIYPPTPDPLEVAAVIERSQLVVTPDTGIVHVASAVRRPVVALYLGSRAGITEWGPHRVPHRIVHSASDRTPVSTIPAEEVIEALRMLTSRSLAGIRSAKGIRGGEK